MRDMRIHAFCSVKGGVGKSTLAVASAKLLAATGSVPVVIDCDMGGASLADGLLLCAPVIAMRGGAPELTLAPSGEWHSLAETQKLRYARQEWLEQHADSLDDETILPPPAYVNDAFFFPTGKTAEEDCSVAAMLWRHQQEDGVRYLPSSPLRLDSERRAVDGLEVRHGFSWVRRLAWIVDRLLEQRQDVTDIILDLPPGTWGVTHEAMVFLGALAHDKLPPNYPNWSEEVSWSLNPMIVTSDDRNDHLLAIDYYLEVREHVPDVALLVNRARDAMRVMRGRIRDNLPEFLQPLGIEQKLARVPVLQSSLGRVFRSGDLPLDGLGASGAMELRETLRIATTKMVQS